MGDGGRGLRAEGQRPGPRKTKNKILIMENLGVFTMKVIHRGKFSGCNIPRVNLMTANSLEEINSIVSLNIFWRRIRNLLMHLKSTKFFCATQ